MSEYEIIPCTLAHLRVLALTMRAEDREEIESVGIKPRHLLMARWRESPDPKTALVNGEVAACWGDAGPILGSEGHLWLFTAPPVERVPLAYFREARRDLMQRLEYRAVLRTFTTDSYDKALRFFGMMGFSAGEPVRLGNSPILYRELRLERPA